MYKRNNDMSGKLYVDITELAWLTSLGKNTAARIGEQAGAVVRVGRRKLYNVEAVCKYLNGETQGVE